MAQLIPMSRAARLVGVKRGTLQKKIRDGELATFEGMIELNELMRCFPYAKVEDDTMLERMPDLALTLMMSFTFSGSARSGE